MKFDYEKLGNLIEISETKNKVTTNKKNNRKIKRNDTSGLNRPRSISINNKINIQRKNLIVIEK